MNETDWADGYQAAIEGNYTCPHPFWSLDYWSWQAGNNAGHLFMCAALEHIYANFPQD